MENQNTTQPPFPNQPFNNQITLPNSTGALVLGIIGLVFSIICHPVTFIMGLIMSIIAVVLGAKANSIHNENPDAYKPGGLNNAKAGKICGIIGIVFAVIWTLFYIAVIVGLMHNMDFMDFDFR